MTSALLVGAVVGGTLSAAGVVLPRLQARREPTVAPAEPAALPGQASLEVIVPAYLESGVIGHTIRQLHQALSLYEGATSVLVVASDASTAAAARRAGAERVIETERDGKAAALNAGVASSSADVIVLTDGNCRIEPEAWVGSVLDELSRWSLVSAHKRETGARERAYWTLERWIKSGHAGGAGTLSVVGEFIALRRSDYRVIPPDTVLDDQWLALELLRSRKYSTVADGISTVEESVSNRDQWERRVRVASGVLTETLPIIRELWATPQGRMLVAHKLYRMTVGAAGFWLAVVCVSFVAPPWTLAMGMAAIAAVLVYSGRVLPRARLGTVASIIGMQGVPVAGALRAWRRSRSAVVAPGWAKVAR